MNNLSAATIAEFVGGSLRGTDATVTGPVVTDSREAIPGSLFVALKGSAADGHDFIDAAVANGAVAVIAEREAEGASTIVVPDALAALGALARAWLARLRDSGDIRVIAVTGSAGKTTTKDLLLQMLSSRGPTIAPVASFNNEVGLPLTVLRADESTRFLVLEMGANHLGELTYLTSIAPPDIAIVLMVGQAHVGEFGGIEAVAKAKAELVQGLRPGGTAILNADDLRVAAMADLADGPVVTFGNVRGTTLMARDVSIRPDGGADFNAYDARTELSAPVSLRLIGAHNVSNALAAIAAVGEVGIDVADAAALISDATAMSPHRMHVTTRADGVTVIDDSYNANPDSMKAALRTLAVIAGRKRRTVALLGEMLELGDASRAHHHDIGLLAVRLNISLTIVVGRGASSIFDGVTQEGSWGDEARFAETLDEAREILSAQLQPGDVVLIKSSHGAGLWQLADELATEGSFA
ncbi:UDP-N-acetylmuramoyl-tripeptide--D-alanyl-D-alanine ligase [Rarobacter faecitabidus]|uniref:UDP-N-acetylmuramoyl-tripeptide--D-alanyl-D-alanine ligase n=1 Tax=Rarobacter faecitabidus TaxID=13243 RepID=A0A542ZW96_RARFA|nr:UDP-N-acetylmuramoyl-tripeptide--D-alanyl-D-alanine ligase [Rarobacter faecitabidus]TQL64621.1 UDP-N-acetylmuramoyl-tripeptide--D-alanyl-D-alanine ligase [Rarobacter faecitabidus]